MKFLSMLLSILMLFTSIPTGVAENAADAVIEAVESIEPISFDFDSDLDSQEIFMDFDEITEVSVWDGTSTATPTYSSTEGAYVIDSAAKLKGFATMVTGGTTFSGYTVKLMININLNSKAWASAGTELRNAFSGTFDGNGCYISNYNIADNNGFFYYLKNATVKNLTFKNIASNVNNRRIAGVLARDIDGTNTFDNVDITDSYMYFTGSDSDGSKHAQNGLIGIIRHDTPGTTTFKNCDVKNLIGYTSDSRSGVFVGNSYPNATVNITNCTFDNVKWNYNSTRCGEFALLIGYAEGVVNVNGITISNGTQVSGINNTGALIGYALKDCTIKNVTATGLSVTSTASRVGGIVGRADGILTMDNINVNNISVTANGTDVGGITGYTTAYTNLTNITINGGAFTTTGTCFGSIVGYTSAAAGANIEKITLKGNVSLTNTGSDYTGGLVGRNAGTGTIYFYDINTKDAAITYSISNKSQIGGIIGNSKGDIHIKTKSMEYNELCAVNFSTGGNYVGGLVGYAEGRPTYIENTRINGNIKIYAYNGTTTYYSPVGGLIGRTSGGNINNVIITGGSIDIKSSMDTGGIVGYNITNDLSISNFSIDSININSTTDSLGGMVGYAASGEIILTNNHIENVTITSPRNYIGGFIGYALGAATIKDSSIGMANLTCSTTTNTGGDYGRVAGAIGRANKNVTISNVEIVDGSITGPVICGGLVANYDASGCILTIENSVNNASVKCNYTSGTGDFDGDFGGLVGLVYNGTANITSSGNTGKIWSASGTTKSKYYGGIIGMVRGAANISNSYNTGMVNGNTCNGGIVGYASGTTNIRYCYNAGDVQASGSATLANTYYSAGGIAGWFANAGTIEYCFNRGAIKAYTTSAYHNGGIVAMLNNASAKVQYCYTTGAITGYSASYYRGSIAGRVQAGTVQYCYTDTLNSSSLYGASTGTFSNNLYLTSANLKGSNYAANTQLGTVYFTTDDGLINANYPILYWMGDPFKQDDEGFWNIWTVGHYSQFLNMVNSGNSFEGQTVRLMADVDLGDLESTTSIGGGGSTTYVFKGTFEGNNFSFQNFTLSKAGVANTGFFGYVSGATIKNLVLDNFNITGGQYTGGLVGRADGTNTFANIQIRNGISVTSTTGTGVGGIIGYSLLKCTVNGVTATGTIDVNGGARIGGILGETPASIAFSNISVGAIDVDSTGDYAGGLAGLVDGTDASTINTVNATGEINVYTSSGGRLGGLVARVDGNLTVSSSLGTSELSNIVLKSNNNGGYIGGLVGSSSDGSGYVYVYDFTIGDITITSTGAYLGGLIATSKLAANIYRVTTGDITIHAGGGTDVGGYLGNSNQSSTVQNCSTTSVTITGAGSTRGGVVGYAASTVSISGTVIDEVYIGTSTTKATQYAGGYIGYTPGAAYISSAKLSRAYIYSSGRWAGGLAGSVGSSVFSTNEITYAYVIGTDCVGGFIGRSNGTTSMGGTNTLTSGSINGASYVGGLIGQSASTATMSGSYSIGSVPVAATGSNVGGVIGQSGSTTTIYNVTMASRVISGTTSVGGFAGSISGTLYLYGTNTASTVTLTASGENCGGVVGYCEGATINNTTLASVYINGSGSFKGGFVAKSSGSNPVNFTGNNSIHSISINSASHSYVGMFAGHSGGKLTLSGTTASVPENFTYVGNGDNNYSRIGAIAGYAAGASISGYDFGNITIGSTTYRAQFRIGGFIGECGGDLTITDCSAQSIKLYTGSDYSSGGTFSHSSSVSYTGGLAGHASGNAVVENCEIGSLTMTSEGKQVGGIIGVVSGTAKLTDVSILDSSSSITVQMKDSGSMIGYVVGGTITAKNCTSYVNMIYNENRAYNEDDESKLGGIVGNIGSGGTSSFENCSNYGNITCGLNYIFTGGIVGCSSSAVTMTNCHNYGTVNSSGKYVGGLFGGYNAGVSVIFTSCTNSGNVTGTEYVGGISGRHYSSTTENKYLVNTGAIRATSQSAGGIFGVVDSAASLRYGYNWGAINSPTAAGGIIGKQNNTACTINNSYSKGTVSGTTKIGGITGDLQSGSLLNCYYLNTSCSYGASSTSNANAIASTAAQFASGEIGWKMNTAENVPYKQDIGTDAFPTFDGAQINRIVYTGDYVETLYCNDETTLPVCTENCTAYVIVDSNGTAFTGKNITSDANLTVTKSVEHNYVGVITSPTCTAGGYTTYTCSICSKFYVDDYINANGHSYVDTITQPTCTAGGYTTHTCSVCKNTYVDSNTDMLGHSYVAVVTDPTCINKGYTTHTCSRCEDDYTDTYTDEIGHNYIAEVVDPTCVDAGYTTHTCSRCNDSYTDTPVEATGVHDYECTATDNTTHTFTCKNCGAQKTENHAKDMDGKCLCDDEFADGFYEVDISFNGKLICFKYLTLDAEFDSSTFSVPVAYRESKYRVGHKTVLVAREEYQQAEDGDVFIYDASFEKTPYAQGPFNVKIIDKGTTTTTQYGWEEKATAKASSSGFLYWVDEYGNIVSTYKTYYFLTVKSTTLTAVYSTDVSNPTESKAFVTTNFADTQDDGSLTFYSERCVNYTRYNLLSYGILLTPSSAIGTNDYSTLYNTLTCTSGNSNILTYDKAVEQGQTAAKCYGLFTVAVPETYLTLNNKGNDLWYARSYVLVETEDGEIEYHYGDIAEFDLSNPSATFTRRTGVKNDNFLIESLG